MLVDIDDGEYEYPPKRNHTNKVYGYMEDLKEMGVVAETQRDGSRAWVIAPDIEVPNGDESEPETVEEWLFHQHYIATTSLLIILGTSVVFWSFGYVFGITFPMSWENLGSSLFPIAAFSSVWHVYLAHRDTDTPLVPNGG